MSEFIGQWLGCSDGDPKGQVLADFDLTSERSNGTVYLFPSDQNIPCSAVDLNIPSKNEKYSCKVKSVHFLPFTGRALSKDELQQQFPEVDFPKETEVEIAKLSNDRASFSWKSDVGTSGKGQLRRTRLQRSSTVPSDPSVANWSDFKEWVSNVSFGDQVFRGQAKPFPLQTSFHRTNRKNLHRYLADDIPRLHRALTGRIQHLFNLKDGVEFGAFLNLAQHHGFPTPLIDWTYSPYIAAWFAFDGASELDEKVRIFCFNKSEFVANFPQMQALTFCLPHFSIAEVLSVANDRAIPQQGLLALTNLQDIEGHLQRLEATNNLQLISAFDLSAKDKSIALEELALMGITRSTLFPGPESVCADMKSRLFT